MIILWSSVALAITWSPANSDSFFGDVAHRHPADVAADIESSTRLPTSAFEQIAPSLISVIDRARQGALVVKAMDALLMHGNEAVGSIFATRLAESLDRMNQDRMLGEKATYNRHMEIQAFLMSPPSAWSVAMRESAPVRNILKRISTDSDARHLDFSMYTLAVDSLIECLPTAEGRKQELVALVGANGPGGKQAAHLLIPIVNDADRVALREFARQPRLNRPAIHVLSYIGDVQTLPYLRARLEQLPSTADPADRGFLTEEILMIELQQTPNQILELLRSSAEPTPWIRFLAIQRSLEIGLEREAVRSAILEWATQANAWVLPEVKAAARKAGILNQDDLPNVPPPVSERMGLCTSPPERRTQPVVIPDKRARRTPWVANQANYEVFNQWFTAQNWNEISDEQSVETIHAKMCELDLLHPDTCGSASTSQPSE